MIARALFVNETKLRVFDFDDVLVKTDSKIKVIHSSGSISYLTPGQYAKYTPKSGDKFDYKDFRNVNNPTIIKAYYTVLKRIAQSNKVVYILTARKAYKPVYKFIQDTGIMNVFVVALDSADPQAKADWIENKIKSDKITDLYFIDDSHQNVEAIKKMTINYPKVKSKIQLAKYK